MYSCYHFPSPPSFFPSPTKSFRFLFFTFLCASARRWRKIFFVPWYAMNLYAIQQSAFIGFFFFHSLSCFFLLYYALLLDREQNKKELKETKIGLWPKNLIRRKILIYRSLFSAFAVSLAFRKECARNLFRGFRAFNLCVDLSKELNVKHLNSHSSTFTIPFNLDVQPQRT